MRRERRPSLADAVALACKSQADVLGRALTEAEHGCIRAGFHACLSYRMRTAEDADESGGARGGAEPV